MQQGCEPDREWALSLSPGGRWGEKGSSGAGPAKPGSQRNKAALLEAASHVCLYMCVFAGTYICRVSLECDWVQVRTDFPPVVLDVRRKFNSGHDGSGTAGVYLQGCLVVQKLFLKICFLILLQNNGSQGG